MSLPDRSYSLLTKWLRQEPLPHFNSASDNGLSEICDGATAPG